MTGEAPRLLPEGEPQFGGLADRLRKVYAKEQAQRDRLMVENYRQSLAYDPTFAANATRLAKSMGMDGGALLKMDTGSIKRLMAARELEARDLSRSNPVLARQLSDPEFARIAHDDLDNLGMIEGWFTEMGRNFQSGYLTIEQGYLADLYRKQEATPEQESQLALTQRKLASLPGSPSGLVVGAFKGLGYLVGTMPEALKWGGAFAAGSAVLPGVTTGGAFVAGMGSGAWWASKKAETGNAFLEMLQRGYDWETASAEADWVGMVNATLEVGGMGAMAAPLQGVVRRMFGKIANPTRVASALRKGALYTAPIWGEMATEFVQEAVNVWGESAAREQTLRIAESARNVVGFDESFRPVPGAPSRELPEATWDEITERLTGILRDTFYSQALLGGFTGGLGYWADRQEMARAEENYKHVQTLAKLYEESKVRERAPDAVHGFAEGAKEEAQAPDLYFQGGDVVKVLQEKGYTLDQLEQAVPGITKQLQESAATGDLVVVDAATFERINQSEFGKALMEHVRVGDDMSFAEAKERDEKAMAEEYERRDAFEAQRREELRQIEKAKREELQAAGQTDTLARANALAYRRMVEQLTQGRSPAAFQAEQGVKVAPEGTTPETFQGEDATLFNQDGERKTDTPEFKAWFGESKVVDEKGEPLVVYHGGTVTETFAPGRISEPNNYRGFYFTPRRKMAQMYGENRGPGRRTLAVYVSMRNPLLARAKVDDSFIRYLESHLPGVDIPGAARDAARDWGTNREQLLAVLAERGHLGHLYDAETLRGLGFDGVVVGDSIAAADEIVVFSPEQIKSVNNRGTFDPADPNILHQTAGGGFFSALAREVGALTTKAATGAGWKQAIAGLVNKGKVKQEEVEWTGLSDWLDMQEGKVSKEQVQAFLEANGVRVETVQLGGDADRSIAAREAMREELRAERERLIESAQGPERMLGFSQFPPEVRQRIQEIDREILDPTGEGVIRGATKFGSYTLPGGENYREVLLTLPPKQPFTLGDAARELFGESANAQERRPGVRLTTEQRQAVRDVYESHDVRSTFRSTHFNEPNIVAHLRLNDRTDADGKRVLFVEEIQSDWAQKGRKEGFTAPEGAKERRARLLQRQDEMRAAEPAVPRGTPEREAFIAEWLQIRDELAGRYPGTWGPIPRAPFVESTKGWLNLALKKVLMLAVEGGYDKVAFINGEQSAERYDLSKQVDSIEVFPPLSEGSDRQVDITVAEHTGRDAPVISLTVDGEGTVIDTRGGDFDGRPLADVVGKDLAERIMGIDETSVLEGVALKVGGEGMRAFYDDIVPKAAQKLAKKLGGKTGETAIAMDEPFTVRERSGEFQVLDREGGVVDDFGTMDEAMRFRDKLAAEEGGELWSSIDITDALRDRVAKGVELFAGEPGKRQGAFRGKTADAGRLIFLLNPQNPTTFMHEMFHSYVDIVEEMLTAPLPEGDRTVELERQDLTRRFQKYLNWLGVADIDAWRSLSPEDKEKFHERGAHGFEVWLGTGEVPGGDPQIRKLFRSFLRWIAKFYGDVVKAVNTIYRSRFGEDLPALTGEVQEFFGEILAAERAVSAAMAARGFEPMFQAKPATMTDEQWLAYQRLEQERRERAVETLVRESIKARAWARKATKTLNDKLENADEFLREQVEKQVRDRIESEPVYRALRFLKTGEVVGDEGAIEAHAEHKLATTATKALLPDADLRSVLPGMTHPKGLHPEHVAEQFQFPSARHMLDAVLSARPLDDVVAEETSQRLMEAHGTLADPKRREAFLDRALASKEHARHSAIEYRLLAGLETPAKEIVEGARRVADRQLGRRTMMRQAGTRWVSNVRPAQFVRAQSRLAREARYRLSQNQVAEAIVAKQQQILQGQMAAAAREFLTEQEKFNTLIKRLGGDNKDLARSRGIDAVNVARALLQAFGLYAGAPLDVPEALKTLAEYDALTHTNVADDVAALAAGARDWRTITVDDYLGLMDTVRALWDSAKRNKQIRDGKELVAFEGVKARLISGLEQFAKDHNIPDLPTNQARDTESLRVRLTSLKAWLRHVEDWAIEKDGGKPGVVHKYLFGLLRAQVDKYMLARDGVYKSAHEVISKLPPAKAPFVVVADPKQGEFDHRFTSMDELLGFVLHMGNEDNLRINAVGRKWVELDDNGNYDAAPLWRFLERMLREGVLTEKHMDAVQFVWDTYDAMRPLSQKAHRENYGYAFPELATREFTVTLPDGRKKTYRGGYAPAAGDPEFLSAHTPLAEEAKDGRTMTLQAERKMSPTTGRGHTIKRTGVNRPLQMSLKEQPGHLDNHLRFIHLQRAGRDIMSLLGDKEIKAALDRVDPSAVRDLLLPWLDDVLMNRTVRPGTNRLWSEGLQALRRNTSTAYMFANVANAMQQLTGLATSLLVVPMKFLRSASAHFFSQLGSGRMAEEAFAKSDFMRARLHLQMGQIVDDIKLIFEPSKLGQFKKWVEEHKFFAQQFLQNPVDIITWHGAYNYAISEGATDAEALTRADSAVRTSQGSATAADISRLERSGPFVRMFTLFGTFWMKQYNAIQSRHGVDRAKAIALVIGLAGVVAGAITQALRGGWDDDDDDGSVWDDVGDWAWREAAQTGAAVAAPLVGPLFARASLSDYGAGRLSPGAAYGAVESMWNFVNRVPEIAMDPDKDWRGRDWKDVGLMVTEILGVPATALMRPVQYWWDVGAGDIRPTGALDALRGTVTGSAAPGTRR